jgi:glycosyltransferase involved in cell wall biosynthesis
VSNSKYIQTLIQKVYNTESIVIYPPTETEVFSKIERQSPSDDFYLCHGRISFHKRIDLAILACLQLGRKLKISGTSGLAKQMEDLKNLVVEAEKADPNKKGLIEFLGRTTDEQVFDLVSQTKAFLFPGKEDFGISPIEMLAAGVPLIAYQAGGALEYVKDGVNGVFFKEQTVECLVEAIMKFESLPSLDQDAIRSSSQAFGSQQFVNSISVLVKK